MPLSRLLAGGMEFADVRELHASVDEHKDWVISAEALGDRNRTRGDEALQHGQRVTAAEWYFAASACYRAAQAAITFDNEDKKRIYRQLVDTFRAAAALQNPEYEYRLIPWEGGRVRAWLIRPPQIARPDPVIVVGGFDGWREEHEFAARYLVRRGIAVLLIEAPGQGETRIEDGVFLDVSFPKAFRAVVDSLLDDDGLGDRVGLWGNSFGGFLAAAAACEDHRIAAVCINGGTVRPAEILDRFPRLLAKMQAMWGIEDPSEALRAVEQFTLTETQLGGVTAPLLVLHGTPDQVFLVENARNLHAWAGSPDKILCEWPDGEHCIYNHPHERNSIIADWFKSRFAAPDPRSEAY